MLLHQARQHVGVVRLIVDAQTEQGVRDTVDKAKSGVFLQP